MLAYLQYPEWLSPVIVPGLPLRWYGLMYLVAFGLTYVLFRRQVKERKLSIQDDDVLNYFFWIIMGLLVGARVFAAFVYDPTGRYLRNPLLVFWPFDESGRFVGLAGMSYHGGLIGVVIAAVIYCKVKKYSALKWGDMLVTAVPLGYTFGRLGNFINGELYGRVTTFALGMVFPHAERLPLTRPWVREVAEQVGMEIQPGQQLINLPRHPSQLYEAFFEGIVLWMVMWFFFRKKQLVDGVKVGIYVIGYGFFRFLIEYVREPDKGIGFPIRLVDVDNPIYRFVTPWNFTTGQILNFLMMAGGLVLILVLNRVAAQKQRTIDARGRSPRSMSSRKLRKKIK